MSVLSCYHHLLMENTQKAIIIVIIVNIQTVMFLNRLSALFLSLYPTVHGLSPPV